METTKNLLKILAMGQLLPPPLSNLHNIIEHFEPQEVREYSLSKLTKFDVMLLFLDCPIT